MKKITFVKLFIALFALTSLFSVSADDTVSIENTWNYDSEVFDLEWPNKDDAISLGQEPSIVAETDFSQWENLLETVEITAEEVDEWNTPLLKTTWWVIPEWWEKNLYKKLISAPAEDLQILYYWGNWCPHCKNVNDFMEANDIESIYKLDKKEVYNNKANRDEFAQVAAALWVEDFAVPFMVYSIDWDATYLIWDKPNIELFKARWHTKDHKASAKMLNKIILAIIILALLGFVIYNFTNKRRWK